ncbi:MAG: response regulator [Desulfonatronovibrio sp.]
MPEVYLLTSDKGIANRIKCDLTDLLPHMDINAGDIFKFSEKMDFKGEINIFVVETGCSGVDYKSMGKHLKSFSKEQGVSILAVVAKDAAERDEQILDAEILESDGILEFPSDKVHIISQLEYLAKISELRVMNQNLGAQLNFRVSRLAGLEKQLRHTNWLLQALNKCGEVIIKANNEQDMLNDVCEIISSSLGSCMVLVGYAEMDPQSSVKIVAVSGEEKEAVNSLKLSWGEGPNGQGPTGTAIRTGKTIFVQNPVNDLSTAPWADVLNAHDVKYILALPIAHAGVGFGALTIYGGRKTEFSSNDLEYMERVAQNIGYGIWFLRHRHKRKLVEKELHKTNELFTLAMEATEDALWDWDVPTGKAYFSPRWYTMLGFEPNELPMTYDSFTRVVHPDDLDDVQEKLRSVMEQGENFSIEFRARTKDGQDRWILSRGKIVKRDKQGKPQRIVGTHIDITYSKRMEQELGEAINKAETANKAKDRFLEAMSHELRTPLNGIMSILQTMTEAELRPSEKEYIQMALDSSRQLLVSINKILELSSLQKGIQCIHSRPFDIMEEMAKITGFFMHMAKNKNLHLDLEVSDDLPSTCVGDVNIIRQIIWNFMDNAIKFTEKGGVVLKVKRDEDRDPSLKEQFIQISFEVIDTGLGIPDELKDDIFEPFGVRDDAQQKRQSGYGVGLSVCKQLAETIGAKIGFDSRYGQGCRFYLAATLERSQEVSAPPEAVQDSTREAKNRQIMVVEDEKINLMLIERMLDKKGYKVLTASDGHKAIEIMEHNSDISLILMDIMIPGHDGFELTRMVREGRFSGLKDVPIVAVTALADSDSREKCFDRGMNAYLSKPIDNQELMGMVKKYVDV